MKAIVFDWQCPGFPRLSRALRAFGRTPISTSPAWSSSAASSRMTTSRPHRLRCLPMTVMDRCGSAAPRMSFTSVRGHLLAERGGSAPSRLAERYQPLPAATPATCTRGSSAGIRRRPCPLQRPGVSHETGVQAARRFSHAQMLAGCPPHECLSSMICTPMSREPERGWQGIVTMEELDLPAPSCPQRDV